MGKKLIVWLRFGLPGNLILKGAANKLLGLGHSLIWRIAGIKPAKALFSMLSLDMLVSQVGLLDCRYTLLADLAKTFIASSYVHI